MYSIIILDNALLKDTADKLLLPKLPEILYQLLNFQSVLVPREKNLDSCNQESIYR
jgi:hypothetical protein